MTLFTILVRYKSQRKYFARFWVRGKLIRLNLKSITLSVQKLRLSDLEKYERQKAEHHTALTDGNMTFADALAMYRQRLTTNAALKPRSKVYREERIAALLKAWRGLEQKDVRKISAFKPLTHLHTVNSYFMEQGYERSWVVLPSFLGRSKWIIKDLSDPQLSCLKTQTIKNPRIIGAFWMAEDLL
jgi:hypothetical protein